MLKVVRRKAVLSLVVFFLSATILMLLTPSFRIKNKETVMTYFIEEPSASARGYRCFEYQESSNPFPSLSDPVINEFETIFTVQPENTTCSSKIEVFIAIMSDLGHGDKRFAQRRLVYYLNARNLNKNFRTIFFVGISPHENPNKHTQLQNSLLEESAKHHDIVQVNVRETLRQNVIKTISVLHWIKRYCAHSDMIIFQEENVLMNIPFVSIQLYKLKFLHEHFVIGSLQEGKVPNYQNQKSPLYTSEQEYHNATFPPFIHKSLFGMPTSTAMMLYEQAKRTPILYIQDVFLTGVCSQKLGIPIIDNNIFHLKRRIKKPSGFFFTF